MLALYKPAGLLTQGDRTGDACLLEMETRERERTGIAALRMRYNKVHGFYIEGGRAQADRVPDDYQRRQTLKAVERYITPELKEHEEKVLSARERALAREKALYNELLDRLAGELDSLGLTAGAVADRSVRSGAIRAPPLQAQRPGQSASVGVVSGYPNVGIALVLSKWAEAGPGDG